MLPSNIVVGTAYGVPVSEYGTPRLSVQCILLVVILNKVLNLNAELLPWPGTSLCDARKGRFERRGNATPGDFCG